METLEKSIEVLNDLIEINNDRIAGFTHAAKELGDDNEDIKALFLQLRDESRENVRELGSAINKMGVEPEMGIGSTGALHRMWLDVKTAFSGHNRKSVLEECERGEDAAKKAYEDALSPDNELPPEFKAIVSHEQQDIIAAHNQVKALRDSEA